MYPAPARLPAAPGGGGGGGAAGGLKFTVDATCERIKEEFNYIQQQYHSLKMDFEKLANEKNDLQRHYTMYYEMSCGFNIEITKQTEIAKRLNAIIAQLLPFLAQEHQQQVARAVERAKEVTPTEINAIIGQQLQQQGLQMQQQGLQQLLQQIQAQQMGGMSPVGFLGFAGAAAAIAGVPAHLGPPATHPAAIAAQVQAQALLKSADLSHRSAAATPEDRKSITITELRRSSSPSEKFRTRTPDLEVDPKRRKEEKLTHESDGEKSDQDLVVDVANECES